MWIGTKKNASKRKKKYIYENMESIGLKYYPTVGTLTAKQSTMLQGIKELINKGGKMDQFQYLFYLKFKHLIITPQT